MELLSMLFNFYLVIASVMFSYLYVVKAKSFDPNVVQPFSFYLILIGAFLTLMFILHIGTNGFLVFIPVFFGSLLDADIWVSTREWISTVVSLTGSVYIFYMIGKNRAVRQKTNQ